MPIKPPVIKPNIQVLQVESTDRTPEVKSTATNDVSQTSKTISSHETANQVSPYETCSSTDQSHKETSNHSSRPTTPTNKSHMIQRHLTDKDMFNQINPEPNHISTDPQPQTDHSHSPQLQSQCNEGKQQFARWMLIFMLLTLNATLNSYNNPFILIPFQICTLALVSTMYLTLKTPHTHTPTSVSYTHLTLPTKA